MFGNYRFTWFVLLFVGAAVLLARFMPEEPWQKYSGSVTEGEKNSFYYRTSGSKMCFVGRMTDDSMTAIYAGHYDPTTAELRTYALAQQFKHQAGLTRFTATGLPASINPAKNPAALPNLMLADKFPVENELLPSAPAIIENRFTESECWDGDKGLPQGLARTLTEKF
jgi:hypothetical protein